MIMTKEKARELKAMTTGRLAGTDQLPGEGTYALTVTQDADEIRKAADRRGAEYFLMGMIIPAHKASAVCQLLQDDQGMMPSPVIMLKPTGSNGVMPSPSRLMPEATIPAMRLSQERSALLPHEQPTIRIKDLEIVPGRHEVKVKGKPVSLTYSEFRILQTLAGKPGWVFDREKIIHAVHGDNYSCTERAVDVQVTGLRKKLGVAGDHIETVRGVGYRFAE
ncbi:MAG TPA: winged helix-turn-helix domain-containing protein [Kiritimatiellia bacterium]|nr:winged helix-turn-helix domain-containing protein [Kiritimatiellia bacterium]HMO98020.1 winged helix-turn-helix domain-containing protein [Kiritimatiellia bacterium]HMP97471.1 winged helix-turn-helix domain-containing protein [Kiritimatiellia bacterium]